MWNPINRTTVQTKENKYRLYAKSANPVHKWSFGDSTSWTSSNVHLCTGIGKLNMKSIFKYWYITAKNSKSCAFSTLLNHQNMILDGNENSWMVMSTTPQIVWVVLKILGW